jgi:hypothetical protein
VNSINCKIPPYVTSITPYSLELLFKHRGQACQLVSAAGNSILQFPSACVKAFSSIKNAANPVGRLNEYSV